MAQGPGEGILSRRNSLCVDSPWVNGEEKPLGWLEFVLGPQGGGDAPGATSRALCPGVGVWVLFDWQ